MREFFLVAIGFVLGSAIGMHGLIELVHKVLNELNF